MRGKAGVLLGLFAFVFIGIGVVLGMLLPPETRYTWPSVFHVAFILFGAGILAIVIRGIALGVSFYTTVDESSIEWGRSNGHRLVGRVSMADLAKVVYTEGIESGFDIILIEKSGKDHKLAGEYLFSDGEAKRLVSFVQQNFPAVEVIHK